jgi:hypothetical protein
VLSLALAASNFDCQITQQWQKDTGRPKKNAPSATETLHPMSFLKTTWTNMCMTQFHVQYLAFATAALHGPPCGTKTSPQQIDTFKHLVVLSTRPTGFRANIQHWKILDSSFCLYFPNWFQVKLTRPPEDSEPKTMVCANSYWGCNYLGWSKDPHVVR